MKQYMLCTFPDEKGIQESNFLFFLAKFYIEKCNFFDDMVCTGEIVSGLRYPANSFERSLIDLNSNKTIEECVEMARIGGYCIDKKQMRKWISKYYESKRCSHE